MLSGLDIGEVVLGRVLALLRGCEVLLDSREVLLDNPDVLLDRRTELLDDLEVLLDSRAVIVELTGTALELGDAAEPKGKHIGSNLWIVSFSAIGMFSKRFFSIPNTFIQPSREISRLVLKGCKVFGQNPSVSRVSLENEEFDSEISRR